MEEEMRREIARLSNVYLTIDLWTNRNMTSFLGITMHFVDAEWKLRSFVLAVDSFLGRHTAENIAEAYDNVIEKFRFTTKVKKVVSDNASSMIKAFQVSLPEFTLHKTGEEINEDNEKQLNPDPEQEMSEEGADLHALLTYLPERVSCFAHTQQLCIKDCLQHSEFAKSYGGKQLGKVAKIVNSVRKSVKATSYLQRKKITLRAQNVTRWNSQLIMLQSVLKDHEEVNAALTLIQSREKITNQDYLALNELVSVLLPFKEAMQQVEGENIVTSSCICPVVLGLLKAMELLKNSNLHYCQKLAANLKDSVSKRLLPYINSPDNRLASLLDPRFKNSWIEDDVEKEEAICLLKTHVASRLGKDDEESCSKEDENPAKKPKLFNFMAEGLKKKRPRNSISEVDSYLGLETMHFDEDPLMYWKKKSEELPTLFTLAKDYLGLTATSAPSERIFSIAGNFYTARRNLLGPETFRTLMFIKCNPTVFEQVKM
ncbi:zinc finger BED domain-containing protein 4-like [Clavelina lepadiformis]|uniref:zinc finger BED domain-containing protein 4-like n=1 Tax=Clavelina lepadiformis TaxID=159417 RepID=UPI00404101A4